MGTYRYKEIEMKNLGITETVLRDGNQSLIATRLCFADFEPILSELDNAGFYSLECWGGATFDTCIRFLNEDPWKRLKEIKKNVKKTKLQMLLRGQSLLGYKHYPDDIVRRFVFKSVENGIDIIRIFDALNDIKNIEVAVRETINCDAHASCAIAYTESPVHNIESYVNLAADMERIGAKSICIKDMSGILSPLKAYELIKKLKSTVSVPIILHSHCTAGLAYMTYLKAIEAGVDVLDTAISSFSGGTSQPATEVISNTAISYERETGLNKKVLKSINSHFTNIANKYKDSGVLELKTLITDPDIVDTQIPGGMYSNLRKQLQDLNCIDKFDEVVSKIPSVRRDLGYPPLVTPLSQMVISQTVMNVATGTEYGHICNEVRSYLNGEYGEAPGEINAKINFTKSKIKTEPDSDQLEQIVNKYEAQKLDDCDLLTCALFPDIGDEFISNRNITPKEVMINDIKEPMIGKAESQNYGKCHIVNEYIEPDYENFIDFDLHGEKSSQKTIINAALPGTVIAIHKVTDDSLEKGDVILVCESMKMENEIVAPVKGVLSKVFVNKGDKVQINKKLAEIDATQ